MIIRQIKDKVPLIDPNLSITEKIIYILFFVIRSFLIASFLMFIFIILILFIYFGDLLINVKSGNYKYPIYSSYVILTPSMVPTINVKDGIFVKRKNNFELGDIISFDSIDKEFFGLNITHRIVSKQKLNSGKVVYRTKGDNNFNVDRSYVLPENINGKVLLIIPKIGYIRDFLMVPFNFILSLLIPILLILFINYYKLKEKKKYIEVI